MVKSCAAVNCKNRFVQGNGITFHSFPLSDKVRTQEWVLKMKRDNFTPTANTKICSEHFDPSCFEVGLNVKKLRKEAVPSVFHSAKSSGKPIRRRTKAQKDSESRKSRKRKIPVRKDSHKKVKKVKVASANSRKEICVHDFQLCLKEVRVSLKRIAVPNLPESSDQGLISDKELESPPSEPNVPDPPRNIAKQHYLHDFQSCLRNGSVAELSDESASIPIPENCKPPDYNAQMMREISDNHPKLFSDLNEDFWEKCGTLGWSFQYSQDKIIFRSIENCIVRKALFVNRSTGNFAVSLCGRPLARSHRFFANRACLETKSHLRRILLDLQRWHACYGTMDPEYVKAWKSNPVNNVYFCNVRNSLFSTNCAMLTLNRERCVQCTKKYQLLDNKHTWLQQCQADALRNASSLNFRGHDHLPRPELTKRCLEFEMKCKKLQLEMDRCKPKLEDLSEKLKRCICGNSMSMCAADAYSTGTDADDNELVHLLMREQLRAIKAKSLVGFKWHSTILKFCAYIYKKSPETYEALRNCGFLHLPAKKSVRQALARLREQSKAFNLDDVAFMFDDSSNTEDSCDDSETGELGNVSDYCGSDRQESVNGDCEQNEENMNEECCDQA